MESNISSSVLLEKRSRCLACGMFLQLMIGLNYAFSVFQLPLMEKFNSPLSTISLLVSLAGLVGTFFSLVIAAKLRQLLGFRKMVMVGGFLYGLSFFLTGLNSGSVFFLFVTLLFLRTFGGLSVDVPIKSYSVELYPDRSGWASGLTTAAFGAAAILWAPLVTALLTRVGDLSKTFLIIGAALMVLLVAVASRLIAVPSDYHERFQRKVTIQAPDRYYNVDRAQMVHLPVFYLFLVSLALALSSGNALLAQCAYYMEALLGTSAESAALTVSALALANMLGRIICGSFADRFGKLNTVFVAQLVSVLGLIACALASSPLAFTVAAMVVIFCFGGMFCLLPPLNEEIFGHQHMTENFTIIFAIPNLAVLLGPMVSSFVVDHTASLSLTMIACTCMSAVGALLMIVILKKLKQVQKANINAL